MWDVEDGKAGGYQRMLELLPPERRVDPASVRVPEYLPDVPEVRQEIARYFECLAVQDMQIGQALDAIDRAGVRDNTVVIYLTDHGRGLPREKQWCYDAGVHLPLIIRRPGEKKAGSVDKRVVSWVDFAPTILELAGVPIPKDYQGRSFLTGERKYALSARDRMDEAYDCIRTITDGRYRYVRNDFPHISYAQRAVYHERSRSLQALRRMDADGTLRAPADVFMQRTKPPEELYDAASDPDMVHNLAANPAHAAKLAELRAALADELERFGDIGGIDERELIARGVVADRLTNEYALRIEPLPEPYCARTGPTVLTRNEALRDRPTP
jgi:arylsulfatase A-like enzyme